MIKEYTGLECFPLKTGSTYVRPVQTFPERIKLNDPAISAMTDLAKVSLASVRARTTMESANDKMIRLGIRMLLVLDDNEQLVGLLTATDILGDKPLRFLKHMGGTHADIMVRDIMTTQRELRALRYADVQQAKIGQIVETMKKANRQHSLVVAENTDGSQIVRGLFSITQIARLLGAQVQNFELARTLEEIEAVILRG
jgi:CBS-domain-containing membrane protein